MTTKKYKAKTGISVNIVLSNGKSHHVSFTQTSDGGSVYYTNNEDIQKGLESHYRYGKLFFLDKSEAMLPRRTKKTELTEESETAKLKKITVSDYDDAKDYLSNTFGVSRTAMRSVKSILDKATENGIEFNVINP